MVHTARVEENESENWTRTEFRILGEQISEIINQDGEDVTDGECLDQVIQLLIDYGIYVEKQQ
jgi:hypothetical protein